MPLKIVRSDLLLVRCDAIVNPSDVFLSGSGSIDLKIHESCGHMLDNELSNYDVIDVSNAIVTKAYNLNTCKYVIHTVGPIYEDGEHNEFNKLRECYRNVLKVAFEHNLESIAVPLISSGTFGFPKKEAYLIAIEEINKFLIETDMLIYLVVYDKESFSISKELSHDVKSYISEKLIQKDSNTSFKSPLVYASNDRLRNIDQSEIKFSISINSFNESADKSFELDESFSESVLRIIDEKELKDTEVYKKALLNRKLFSTLRSNKDYRPSKKTAISLCIALELNIDETNDLLKKAGFVLSHSNLFDVIIEYYIIKGIFDMYEINCALLDNDQEIFG